MAASNVLTILVGSCLLTTLLCIWITPAASAPAGGDYREALGKAILFFEGQRAGKLPANQRAKWRGDSALSDGSPEKVNLAGGYYDAGDNVKFGWPMAFTTSLLSWAAVEYGAGVQAAGEMENLRAAIQWGTDFLINAHASPTTLYTQVGDGNKDHECWERPEDMDTDRTLYKVTEASPGSEPAADAAAALAAASMVFKQGDAKYSQTLLSHAKQLFEFADKHQGSYKSSCPFYCSYSGFQDELLWAAAWLYKATGDNTYLNYLSTNQGWSQSVSEFSWDNKFAGAQALLAKEFLAGKQSLSKYKQGADSFVCSLIPGSGSASFKTTPGGLLFFRDASNLQYTASASMVLLSYANTLAAARADGVQCGSTKFPADKIRSFAQSQVDYILGNNPMKMSYMVGFGNKFPTQLHHRGSSIPSIRSNPNKIGCNDGKSWFSSQKPNPNIHVGAIVGGPDSNDRYPDSRSDYAHAEPTTYINAAFVGSVAALLGQSKPAGLHMGPFGGADYDRSDMIDY
ncbi:endoglucanase 20-like [Andrographis paniculata]|uniref:endoglucanase 20-like n=1 Tax=Andrographis paniculata TaxID=175694 RepID=UPI0021E97B50|nr:endoglucanase 20-like [Andrographis paniculata]